MVVAVVVVVVVVDQLTADRQLMLIDVILCYRKPLRDIMA